MKEFHGEAVEVVDTPVEDCFALLAAIDGYPDWCPDVVRDVEVLDRGADGQPSRVRVTMRIAAERWSGSSICFSRSSSSRREA